LGKYVKPFHATRLKPEVLRQLVSDGEYLEIECDSLPFSHLTNDVALLEDFETHTHTTAQQQANA